MLPLERTQKILARLRREGRVVVADLAQSLAVTEETIRRDLHKLERQGLLRRSHGGALPLAPDPADDDPPYRTREVTNIAAKRRIALLAAAEIRNGQSVMLDSSSTAREVVAELRGHADLTLITNSVPIVTDSDAAPHTLISVGGELLRPSMTFAGPLAVAAIRGFHADVTLISAKALSSEAGLMDASAANAELKRAFLASGRRRLLLVDASKFDAAALISIAPLAAVDTVITDKAPSLDWRRRLADAGVALIHGT